MHKFILFIHLVPTMSAILSLFIHLFAQSCKTMFDYSVRWGFGPRPPVDDEEAATNTTPLLQAEGSYRTETLVPDGQDAGSYPRTTAVDPTPPTTPSYPVSFVDVELPSILTPSLPRNTPSKWPVFESSKESKRHRDYILSNTATPPADGSSLDMLMLPLLEPVRENLVKLKALTPESLPPYNPRLRTQPHAQILKRKLIPIGGFIVNHINQVAEDKRGALELQLCRYIASNYWPLLTDEYTHLRIHEMYRNALYMSSQQPPKSQPSDTWVRDALYRILAQPVSNTIPCPDQDTPVSDSDHSE